MNIRKFPHYKQNNASDCGPTCLRMISKHYHQEYSSEMLRKCCHISRSGANMLGIRDGAEHIESLPLAYDTIIGMRQRELLSS